MTSPGWHILVVLFILLAGTANAQDPVPSNRRPLVLPLQVSAREFSDPDSLPSVVTSDTSALRAGVPRASKSPGTAVLLSALVPGAGQVYNESYWKVPIIVGLGTYFVVELIRNNNLYREYSDKYQESLRESPPTGDPQALRLREFYREERTKFGWYFLILYVVNLLDAYVDAVLFDFEVTDDLSLRSAPWEGTLLTGGPRLAFRIRL
ncbi:MAG: DUF5683 domain-containing protein [Bacteroidota bacterium]